MLWCNDSFARPPQFSNPMVHRFNYGFVGLFGQGQMGNAKANSPYRNMDFTTYQAFLGFRISNYRFSAAAEYSYVAQKTNVEAVANTNLTGQSFSYGPKIEYYDGKESIGFIYRLNSNFNLNKLDANNNKQYYASKTGMNIQYTRRLKNNLGIVIDYAREEYGKSLPDKIKWDRISIGFIFSNFDKYPFPLPN